MSKNLLICQALYCENTNRNCKKTFFVFPTNNPSRLEKWVSNIRMKPIARTRQFLCSDHFGVEAFTNTLRRRLLPRAAPSIQVEGGVRDKTTCSVIKIESIEIEEQDETGVSSEDVMIPLNEDEIKSQDSMTTSPLLLTMPPNPRTQHTGSAGEYSSKNEKEENRLSEPVLEFVGFDALDDSSPNDSPSTTQDNYPTAPEIKQAVINDLPDQSKSNHKEHQQKAAPKRKLSPDRPPAQDPASQNDDEDDCDLYGKLIAKKLRKLPDSQRERLMYEIQGLFLKFSQCRPTS